MEYEELENENGESNAVNIFHPTHNLIDIDNRKKAVGILSKSLGSCFDLYANLKTAHWNIKGALFISLHKLFDELAEEVLDLADQFAERITALGGTADGRLKPSHESSILSEFNYQPFDGYSYISQLCKQIATLSKHLQDESRMLEVIDPTTANFYLEVAMQLDKQLYFLEAHLQLN